MNSLYIFLAFVAFLVFGYLSHIRILSKHFVADDSENSAFSLTELARPPALLKSFTLLGVGSFLTILPSISILLFWGWGPALVWLVVMHLIFETTFNFLLNSRVAGSQGGDSRAANNSTLWHLMLVILSMITIAILVRLLIGQLNQHSGQIFLLLACLVSLAVYEKKSSYLAQFLQTIMLAAMVFIAFGFSKHLGLTIFGNWQPFSTAPWLNFNNSTIYATAFIAIIGYTVRPKKLVIKNRNKQEPASRVVLTSPLARRLAALSGLLFAGLFSTFLWQIFYHQPLLDAPIQGEASELPSMATLSLLLGIGLTVILVQYLALPQNAHKNSSPQTANHLVTMQQHGILIALLSGCLLLVLASALGIGAWNSHYLDWSILSSASNHTTLSLNAIAEISNAGKFGGDKLVGQFFVLALMLICLSAICFWVNQIFRSTNKLQSAVKLAPEHSRIFDFLMILVCIVVSFFIIAHDISIYHWLIVGTIAWFMLGELAVSKAVQMEQNPQLSKYFSIFCLIFILAGIVQISCLVIQALFLDDFAAAIFLNLILIAALVQWSPNCFKLIKTIGTSIPTTSLFEQNKP